MKFADYRTWIGVISGMIVWAIWFVVVYSLTGIGCDARWDERAVAGAGNLLSLILLVSSAIALSVIGWCARRGYVGWQDSGAAGSLGTDRQQRVRFMGITMLVLSLLAAAGTLMITIPMVMLDPCAT